MIPDAFEAIGTQLSLPISAVLLAVGVALAVLSILKYREAYSWSEEWWFWGAVLGVVISFVSAIVLVTVTWGWAPRYWTAYRVEGTITSVSATLDGANNEVTVEPVLTLDTMHMPVALDDPRAMTLDGREVELTCYVRWHVRAADSYHCQIAAIR